MDELFELCKEVYERFPEWGFKVEELDYFFPPKNRPTEWRKTTGYARKPVHRVDWFAKHTDWEIDGIPLYTSDYLLEKLPIYTVITKRLIQEEGRDFSVRFTVSSDHESGKVFYSDTPLKALLKLVLALKENGEI